jgi:predicted DsbA family dithiol-disulfide isomerase
MHARVTAMGREVGIDSRARGRDHREHLPRAPRAAVRQVRPGGRISSRSASCAPTSPRGATWTTLDTLVGLGAEVGLDGEALRAALAADDSSDPLGDAVRRDLFEARQLGIGGVPFFVLDRKYGVSGAQGSDALVAALTQAHDEREHS